jgi:hypothetical protein
MLDEVPPGPSLPGAEPTPATVAPGALSALLAELTRAPDPPETAEPEPGAVIGRFELKRRLGAGGFGVVWEARDRQLCRSVAFKLIRPGERAELREESLLREAEAAARLSHDNIVALHDVGTSSYGPYLVLELLHGRTLGERVAAGPVPLREALRLVRDVARGVAHAHAEGVVHRDLKPANVFVCDDGRVKVLDFGLAHAFGRRRQSGGTPAYMAPEQWKDAPEDERTDVFALGVILYQALTGALPFAGEAETLSGRPAPTLEVPAAPALGPLVARMLEKDPLKRPRDALELLPVLDVCLEALGPAGEVPAAGARASAETVRVRRHPRWRPAGYGAAGVALGVAFALLVTMVRQGPATVGGRLLVAVADVANETGEKELDVLSGLLVTSLEQSRRLEVMTQARVLDLAVRAGRQGATRVDETVGRAVGLESKAAALLLPAIRRLGSTYAVELRAIDPVRDRHLFTVSDRASSKDGLFDLLDRLSEAARQQLKEDPAEVEKNRLQLGESMTRSVEAYQHYLAGIEGNRGNGLRAVALREQQDAIRLDPRFAAAHLELASVYEDSYGRPDLAEPHWAAADRFADRMPEKERGLLRLWRVFGGRASGLDEATTLQLVDELTARFPNDKYLLTVAAMVCAALDKPERQEALLRRALALDPGFFYAALPLASLLLTDHPDEAVSLARHAVATRRSAANLAILAEALANQGDGASAGAAAREALQLDGGQNSLVVLNACGALPGQIAATECRPIWERMMVAGLNPLEQDRARLALVQGLAVQGRIREALRLSESVEEARRGHHFELSYLHEIGRPRLDAPEAFAQALRDKRRVFRAGNLAYFGKIDEAERVSATLEIGERSGLAEKFYQTLVLVGRGRHAEALEGLQLFRDFAERNPVNSGDYFLPSYLLAETLLAAGRPEEADAIRPGRLNTDPVERAVNYPRLALVRARALEQLGRRAEAVKELDALLTFWKDADADLPLLVEAKLMRARLAVERR